MPNAHEEIAEMARAYTAAWNSGNPKEVASFFTDDGEIVIDRSEPSVGQGGIAAMAAGFFADVPDLALTCDRIRCAGSHVVFMWTFTGHDANTNNPLKVSGWEEWDLNDDLKVRASRGWFDAQDYARQLEGG